MKSRSDFSRTPYLSLTSLIRAPLFERSVKIERALSTKMRDTSDVGLKILLAKFSCDLCDGLAPDTKISSILSKNKFTSRSCSCDFLRSTFFSDLFAFSASQNVVLRSFSLSSRRSRVPINNFMSPFISSMPTIGRSTNPWAAGVSCCFRDLKSPSTTRSGFFKGSNRRLFFLSSRFLSVCSKIFHNSFLHRLNLGQVLVAKHCDILRFSPVKIREESRRLSGLKLTRALETYTYHLGLTF